MCADGGGREVSSCLMGKIKGRVFKRRSSYDSVLVSTAINKIRRRNPGAYSSYDPRGENQVSHPRKSLGNSKTKGCPRKQLPYFVGQTHIRGFDRIRGPLRPTISM